MKKGNSFKELDCKKFLQKESEIFIDEGKLILHGLAQFYVYIN